MLEKNHAKHLFYLLMTLEEAKKAREICRPNPSVGCVAIQGDTIIARAHHAKAGQAHAEILAMAQFPAQTSEVTLYISLEPCNHWGKTPPCIDAIVAHGIQRVIYAQEDPNPKLNSRSTTELFAKHGIELLHVPVAEITAFYQAYVYWTKQQRPWVVAKWAQSLDAKIAYPGQRVHLSHEKAAAFTHLGRQEADVILSTAATIQVDDPQLTLRIGAEPEPKILAIIDSNLVLTGTEECFKHAKKIHVFHRQGLRASYASDKIQFHPLNYATLAPLDEVLDILARQGYHSLWVEAGARLLASLHQAQLVQVSHIYIVAKVLGSNAISAFAEDFNTLGAYSFLQWTAMDDNMRLTIFW